MGWQLHRRVVNQPDRADHMAGDRSAGRRGGALSAWSPSTTASVRRAYRAYTVSGTVSGVESGTVTIQRLSAGQWRRLKSTPVGYGSYSTTIRPSKKMRIRVRFSGTSSYLPSTSREATVKRVR